MKLRQETAAIAERGVELGQRSDIERDHEVGALFRRHYTPMCRLAFVILGDAGLAEEVVMEALVKTFSGWRRIRDLDRSEAYLRRAVVNGCRSKIRRKMVESRAGEELRHRVKEQPPGWDDEGHLTRQELWRAVQQLPDRQRACVVLFYYEDLPEAEIADILDCSLGTVKSQLFKARAKLERAMRPALGDA